MDLKWLLVRRITLVAIACLLVAAGFAIYRTASESRQQSEELVELIGRQLDLQLSRIKRATDVPARFPDWDVIAGLSLGPGQCVELRGATAAQQPARSSCAGIDSSSLQAPLWFRWAYETMTRGNQIASRPIYLDGRLHATVVVEHSHIATAERAWATVAPLLGFSAAFAAVLCLVIYFVIERALRPTKEILSGLGRLARGDLECRLPAFQLGELNRISEGFNALLQDLSKATAERTELARRLVDSQEQERRHIARELHDEIAQKLSALNAHAACLRTRAQREAAPLASETKELEGMASALMISLRRTLTYLRPQEIDDLGLERSLKDLVARHNEAARGRTSYSIGMTERIGRLTAETSAHVYRIVQEALTNASKHANARNVEVRLSQVTVRGAEKIHLSVINDGGGPAHNEQAVHPGGAGIIGMRERVLALSGQFSAGSLPGGGFALHVEFPTLERAA